MLHTHFCHRSARILYTQETREISETFGSSLLLANSPMSPKIVNGSYVAICDSDDAFVANEFAGIRMATVSYEYLNSVLFLMPSPAAFL